MRKLGLGMSALEAPLCCEFLSVQISGFVSAKLTSQLSGSHSRRTVI
jgi:hypothetical protein